MKQTKAIANQTDVLCEMCNVISGATSVGPVHALLHALRILRSTTFALRTAQLGIVNMRYVMRRLQFPSQ